MSLLNEIGTRYGTDKSSEHHAYLDIYDQEIQVAVRGTLLELGWLDGASIKMWRDWLPTWTIIGLDIDPKEPIAGTHFVQGSQDDPAVLARLIEQFDMFDVVIDDASHEPAKSVVSFNHLWPWVKPGGVYFIEDMKTVFLDHWGGDSAGEAFHWMLRTINGQNDIQQISVWESLLMVRKRV